MCTCNGCVCVMSVCVMSVCVCNECGKEEYTMQYLCVYMQECSRQRPPHAPLSSNPPPHSLTQAQALTATSPAQPSSSMARTASIGSPAQPSGNQDATTSGGNTFTSTSTTKGSHHTPSAPVAVGSLSNTMSTGLQLNSQSSHSPPMSPKSPKSPVEVRVMWVM